MIDLKNLKRLLLASTSSCALVLLTNWTAIAATLATVTYDTDSYIFIGTNNEFDSGVTVTTDYSGGVLDVNNSHITFAVMKFGDLRGLQTVANGGPSKYLTLQTLNSGSASYGVSVAAADIINGYPSTSGSFNGPAGTATDRLQWYFDNIKGDDSAYGGYAGGAEHVGVFDFAGGPNTYSLDVTAVVDAWLDGAVPNHGFGIWGISSPGGTSTQFDLASAQHVSEVGARLTDMAVPEPATLAIALLGIAGAAAIVRRR